MCVCVCVSQRRQHGVSCFLLFFGVGTINLLVAGSGQFALSSWWMESIFKVSLRRAVFTQGIVANYLGMVWLFIFVSFFKSWFGTRLFEMIWKHFKHIFFQRKTLQLFLTLIPKGHLAFQVGQPGTPSREQTNFLGRRMQRLNIDLCIIQCSGAEKEATQQHFIVFFSGPRRRRFSRNLSLWCHALTLGVGEGGREAGRRANTVFPLLQPW